MTTKTTKTKLTATLPDGTTATRTTARTYTHVLAVYKNWDATKPNGETVDNGGFCYKDVSWHATEELARKAKATFLAKYAQGSRYGVAGKVPPPVQLVEVNTSK